MIIETITLGRNGSIDLLLVADDIENNLSNSPQQLDSVTKMILLEINGKSIIGSGDTALSEISSDTYVSNFSWDLVTTGTKGKLILNNLGLIDDLNSGTFELNLIVFDAVNSDGIPWDRFLLKILPN